MACACEGDRACAMPGETSLPPADEVSWIARHDSAGVVTVSARSWFAARALASQLLGRDPGELTVYRA